MLARHHQRPPHHRFSLRRIAALVSTCFLFCATGHMACADDEQVGSISSGVAIPPEVTAEMTTYGSAVVYIEARTNIFPDTFDLGIPRSGLRDLQRTEVAVSALASGLVNKSGITAVDPLRWSNGVYATVSGAAGINNLIENKWAKSVSLAGYYLPSLAQSIPWIGVESGYPVLGEGSGLAIAVIDSGVEVDHPFFGQRVIGGACFRQVGGAASSSPCPPGPQNQTMREGLNFAGPCPASKDCQHGTHVAGIAAGDDPTDPALHGVAKGANIVSLVPSSFRPIDGCDDVPCVIFPDPAVAAALLFSYNRRATLGIRAVNMSLGIGSGTCRNRPYAPIVLQLRRKGIAVVAAAGNEANDPGYVPGIAGPACLPSIISVGASDESDNIEAFSQFGPDLDLLAPGDDIESAVPGGAYADKDGTSMAAPHVAAAMVLLASHNPTSDVDRNEETLKQNGVAVLDPRNGLTFPRLRLSQGFLSSVTPNAPDAVQVPASPTQNSIPVGFVDTSAFEDQFQAQARLGNSVISTANIPPNDGDVAFTQGTIAGLSPGTTYSVHVRSCRSGYCSSWVSGGTATTQAIAPPAPVTWFRVRNVSSTSFEVQWPTPPPLGASHYKLVVWGPGHNQTLTIPIGSSTYTRTGLQANEHYSLFMMACKSTPSPGACSSARDLVIRTVGVGPSPYNFRISSSSQSPQTWTLAWDMNTTGPNGVPTGYELESYVPTSGGFIWVSHATATTSYVYTPPAPVHSPSFRVRACWSSGCSDYAPIIR